MKKAVLKMLGMAMFITSCGGNDPSDVKGIGSAIPTAEQPVQIIDAYGDNFYVGTYLKETFRLLTGAVEEVGIGVATTLQGRQYFLYTSSASNSLEDKTVQRSDIAVIETKYIGGNKELVYHVAHDGVRTPIGLKSGSYLRRICDDQVVEYNEGGEAKSVVLACDINYVSKGEGQEAKTYLTLGKTEENPAGLDWIISIN